MALKNGRRRVQNRQTLIISQHKSVLGKQLSLEDRLQLLPRNREESFLMRPVRHGDGGNKCPGLGNTLTDCPQEKSRQWTLFSPMKSTPKLYHETHPLPAQIVNNHTESQQTHCSCHREALAEINTKMSFPACCHWFTAITAVAVVCAHYWSFQNLADSQHGTPMLGSTQLWPPNCRDLWLRDLLTQSQPCPHSLPPLQRQESTEVICPAGLETEHIVDLLLGINYEKKDDASPQLKYHFFRACFTLHKRNTLFDIFPNLPQLSL